MEVGIIAPMDAEYSQGVQESVTTVLMRKAKPWAKLGRYNRTSDTNGIYSIGCVHVLIRHGRFIVRMRVRVDVGAEMSNRSELRFEKLVGRRAVRTYIVYLEPVHKQIPTHIYPHDEVPPPSPIGPRE